MCAVSVVLDYWGKRPEIRWTPETFSDLKGILSKLDALDLALNQPDCHDPAKATWMRDVEARLSRLEGATTEGENAPA